MTPFRTLAPVIALALGVLAALTAIPDAAQAQNGPPRIRITDGVIEPLPFAVPDFVAENGAGAQYAAELTRVVAADLSGTGLFREIPASAHISRITSFDAPVSFPDWQAINAQALVVGAVSASGDQIVVKFRLFDVFCGQQMGEGLQFAGTPGHVAAHGAQGGRCGL